MELIDALKRNYEKQIETLLRKVQNMNMVRELNSRQSTNRLTKSKGSSRRDTRTRSAY